VEAVAVGGLKRARGGAYNGPEAAAATLKKLRLDAATAAAAAAAAMNMPPTGHTPPLQVQQQQGPGSVSVDGQQSVVTGMCNSIDSIGPGEEEVNIIIIVYYRYNRLRQPFSNRFTSRYSSVFNII